ncbi:plasmid maintenance protein CcdB [Ruegeria denitrificans]|uniref:Toxin CcdB n=1 Tax=Ruegeria denitrificans TaxID=1715692 RepID=A0A0P1J0I8_9RHOB|nr:CcdB family protein [Ruegeria denitrificans]CUK19739.1 plasmid maintenance protein CcdB [Ruegeria denitrificans]
MPKYDVFPNPSGEGYLLDIQTDLLGDLNTRVVAPLMQLAKAPKPATRLNPVFTIQGEQFAMVTQFMAAVPVGVLKSPTANLKDEADRVTVAIDMLMQGF